MIDFALGNADNRCDEWNRAVAFVLASSRRKRYYVPLSTANVYTDGFRHWRFTQTFNSDGESIRDTLRELYC